MPGKEYLLFFSLIFFSMSGNTQEQTTTEFSSLFTLNLSMEYNFIAFEQTSLEHSLITNRPWDFGIGIGILNISFGFSISVPSLYDESHNQSQAFDISFNSYNKDNKYFFYGFLKYYSGFNDGDHNEFDLDILNSGFTWASLFNREHSIRSVYKLDRKQTVSNGSFLLGGGAFLTAIKSEGGELGNYSERQIIFHTGPHFGFSYTWVIENFFINILSTAGINFIVNNAEITYGLQIMPRFSIGFHGRRWSANIYSNFSYFLADFQTETQYNILSGDVGAGFVRRF